MSDICKVLFQFSRISETVYGDSGRGLKLQNNDTYSQLVAADEASEQPLDRQISYIKTIYIKFSIENIVS